MPHPYKTELHSPDKVVKIDGTQAIDSLHPTVVDLVQQLDFLNVAVPMASFKLDRQGQSNDFKYELSTKDGREFNQVIEIISANPLMSFDVPDRWRLSEFSAHRPLRNTVIKLVLEFGVEKITCDWA